MSNFRCSEIKAEAIELFKCQLAKVKDQYKKDVNMDLNTSYNELTKEFVEQYRQKTINYDDAISRCMEDELK